MKRIFECGIGAVCVEARPHPDFLGSQWWHDMDIIVDEARTRKMKVWILDDAHFPTGGAAGMIKKEHPDKARLLLATYRIDVIGPAISRKFLPFKLVPEGAHMAAIVAAKRKDGHLLELEGYFTDITHLVKDGIMWWDVPEGSWSIFICYKSRNMGWPADYLNPLEADATDVLINTVYEGHYDRYKDDFGTTIAGFFSDEPCLGNVHGYDKHCIIGKNEIPIPWSNEMDTLMQMRLGDNYIENLPYLWMEGGKKGAFVKYVYMDIVSHLYEQNFTYRIQKWCKARGVEYIGHVLEDDNSHGRLGCGTGHFFRALKGQDMSGIDVVLLQIMPGFDSGIYHNITGNGDNEFYHYGLAQLCASQARIDSHKKGRAMCEIYGAYGWSEGVRFMKWLTDFMLVRGINHFVPHAFSPNVFPDADCPPHFYAHGHFTQYKHFGLLMNYTDRIASRLSAGIANVEVAVLYHAEAEWCGKAMLFQAPVHELARIQINCDILPSDVFAFDHADGADYNVTFDGSILQVEKQKYKALVIPYCEYIRNDVVKFALKCANSGNFKVIFIDKLPIGIADLPVSEWSTLIYDLSLVADVVELKDISTHVEKLIHNQVTLDKYFSFFRSIQVCQNGKITVMCFNESPVDTFDGWVSIPNVSNLCLYDAFNDVYLQAECKLLSDKIWTKIKLLPGQSTMIVTDDGFEKQRNYLTENSSYTISIQAPWEVSIMESCDNPLWKYWGRLDKLCDFTSDKMLPNFSGTIRYKNSVEIEPLDKTIFLELKEVYETVDIYINDCFCSSLISAPYLFNITKYVHNGQNHIAIDVTNTLGHQQKDDFSARWAMEPSGLIGDVIIKLF